MTHETKQLIKNLAIGFGVFALIGLILYGVWHGTRATMVTISEVRVVGGETISHTNIATTVQAQLQGEYIGFIPREFTWLYPEAEIRDILTQTPRVKDPIIERDGTTLLITLAEFEPVALWCDVASRDQCVFLDNNGYGFAAAPALFGGAYTRYMQVGQTASTSVVFTDAGDFALLQQLVGDLEQIGWPVATIELDQARDAFVELSGGGELKVSLTLTPEQTIDNLQTIRSAAQYADLVPDNFAYIDLRFGNKVFVSREGDPADIEVPEIELVEGEGAVATTTETDVLTEENEVAQPEVVDETAEIETAASDDAAGE